MFNFNFLIVKLTFNHSDYTISYMESATLFNPVDNSLETKVKSVRDIQKAFENVKASVAYSKANGYTQVLGTKEELDKAYILSKDSYKSAVKSFSDSDIKKARREELISSKEFKELTVAKHKTKVDFIRSNQMNPEEKKNVKGKLNPEDSSRFQK